MVEKITNFLLELVYFAVDWLYNAMIEFFNALILVLSYFIEGLVVLFPSNPCGSLIASCTEATATISTVDPSLLSNILGVLAWLMPMAYLVNLVGCLMMSIMIYFAIAPLMRWAKLIT